MLSTSPTKTSTTSTTAARVFVSANLTTKTVGVVGDGIWDFANETISSL